MFERLLSFLKDLPGSAPDQRRPAGDDPRIAAAALMFHVMDADGERAKDERAQLEKALTESYDIDKDELQAILTAGEEADREAVDLYAFTSVLTRHLDKEARLEFIRAMWDIVYADGVLHELEDNVVWRVAELIGVDSQERIALRRSVQGASPDGEEGES
jgi:uncharacterized tellurite resistance protein B-like protein